MNTRDKHSYDNLLLVAIVTQNQYMAVGIDLYRGVDSRLPKSLCSQNIMCYKNNIFGNLQSDSLIQDRQTDGYSEWSYCPGFTRRI